MNLELLGEGIGGALLTSLLGILIARMTTTARTIPVRNQIMYAYPAAVITIMAAGGVTSGMAMLASGQPLAAALRRAGPSPSLRLALEIAITRRGGWWVGEQLLASPLTPWHRSIRLTWWALPGLVTGALQDLRTAA